MSIFTRPRPPVKPTRRALPSARPFGEGLLPDRGERRMPYTVADLEWAAQNLNDEVEPDWDAMAAESEALDRHERGYCL